MQAQGSVIRDGKQIPLNPPPAKEKKVNVNKWKINGPLGLYLITHTATWCNPCQRVKPTLLTLMKNCEHQGSKEIPKSKRPDHVKFIPWFDVVDSTGKIVNSLQSSKGEELEAFLDPFLLKVSVFSSLDEDF